ncbi:MAG: TolC family protein [Thermoguttaceae bacterium]|jgi:NodT family efflux transporter outer membrane factor (OMF) lipoprotein
MDPAGRYAPRAGHVRILFTLVVLLPAVSGCTSVRDYFHNGFKVGPSYGPPQTDVAKHWIDAADPRMRSESPDLSHWWTAFNDRVLNDLICDAYRQNLTLKEAGMRVLEARAQLAIARGNFFPQTQTVTGGYQREGTAVTPNTPIPPGASRFFNNFNFGFNLAWQLDFWGQFRRAIEAADDSLCSSVEAYDAALVTLLGDVATAYIQVRQAQQEIEVVKANAKLQRGVVEIIKVRLAAGTVTDLDVAQAETALSQLESQIPQFEITRRQAENQLCVLMGMPTVSLRERLGAAPIPAVAPEVVVGVPAELLCRRPDVRQAQYDAAAQAEQIGIAAAQFYPAISLTGTLSYDAAKFSDLFRSTAMGGSVGPSFQWSILNYGRILGNFHYQDAKFRELLLAYCNAVLTAHQEAENGIVTFLEAQQKEKVLAQGEVAAEKAVEIVIEQYRVGQKGVDFNRVATIEQALAQQQDLLAQSRGQIALGLVQTYQALGGGWQIRLAPQEGRAETLPPTAAKPAEMIPAPVAPELFGPPAAGVAPPDRKAPPGIPEPVVAPAPVPVPDLKPDRKPLP